MVQLSEAYVIGLLSDLEEKAPQLQSRLSVAKNKAEVVDAELSNLLRRLDASKAALHDAQSQVMRSGININDANGRIAALHQEIAQLKNKGADINVEMERVKGEPQLRRKLRRARAKVRVQVEEREEEIAVNHKNVDQERNVLQQAESTVAEERDRARLLTEELQKLQSQLPSPYLYTELFETLAARAHCRFFLDRDVRAWQRDMAEAIEWTLELHQELRAGKYPLDRNSDLVGGRAMATVEAVYAAIALGERDLAKQIFEDATDPSLFFHQIFNVFRVWCLGLFLNDSRKTELRELLRLHQFAEGLRGGYVNAFIGLLLKQPRRVAMGIKDITRHEWELWQDPSLVRGAGVVNVGAIALSRLAVDSGFGLSSTPGPTVPRELFAAQPKP